MIRKSVERSTGWNDEDLHERIEGFVSDGAYQGQRNRVYGGGYLSLGDHLEEQLQLAPGVISDNYDLGHLVQLSIGDVFKEENLRDMFEEISDRVYGMMAEFKDHKSLLVFEEVARDLKETVIMNRGRQDTRWVRAMLSALNAFFRNATTIHSIYTQRLAEAVVLEDEEARDALTEKISVCENPEFWIALIGLTQILCIICDLSLKVQKKDKFPVSALQDVEKTLQELTDLGN